MYFQRVAGGVVMNGKAVFEFGVATTGMLMFGYGTYVGLSESVYDMALSCGAIATMSAHYSYKTGNKILRRGP